MRHILAAGAVCAAGAVVSAACAPDGPTGPGAPIMVMYAAGGSVAAGGTPGAPGAGGTYVPTGAGGRSFNPMPGTGGGFDDDRDACAGTSQEVMDIIVEKQVPVTEPIAFMVMLDRSTSMTGFCPGSTCSPTGWQDASGAIQTFFTDPASTDLSASIGFFPPLVGAEECATADSACCTAGANCKTLAVPMGPLPGNAQPLIDAMANAAPPAGGGFGQPILRTPTECALRGMIEACKEHTAATGVKCAAILVTDGAPTECSGAPPMDPQAPPADPAALRQIVADGLAAGVTTFTLGMEGADFVLLDQLAEAGGGDCTPADPAVTSCDVRAGQQAFLQALQAIRETVVTTEYETQHTKLDCQWTIPPAPEGEDFDKDRVRVEFTADGIAPQQLGFVGTEADCPNYQGGWYYDNADAPNEVRVCPETCEIVKASEGARMEIQFDCAVIPPVPK